ncbi:FlgN-like protein [Trinorchestia longiramus]|nr:FlgN-like protein [Trinorchestia longiramus]
MVRVNFGIFPDKTGIVWLPSVCALGDHEQFQELVEQFQELVEQFQELVEQFQELVEQFQELVEQFQELVEQFQELVEQFQELVEQFQELVEQFQELVEQFLGRLCDDVPVRPMSGRLKPAVYFSCSYLSKNRLVYSE